MLAGQPQVIIFTVDSDMFKVLLFQLLDGILDSSHTLTGCSHVLGGVVGVATGTVPVTLQRLRVERRLYRVSTS